jgi:hypothetical protein
MIFRSATSLLYVGLGGTDLTNLPEAHEIGLTRQMGLSSPIVNDSNLGQQALMRHSERIRNCAASSQREAQNWSCRTAEVCSCAIKAACPPPSLVRQERERARTLWKPIDGKSYS